MFIGNPIYLDTVYVVHPRIEVDLKSKSISYRPTDDLGKVTSTAVKCRLKNYARKRFIDKLVVFVRIHPYMRLIYMSQNPFLTSDQHWCFINFIRVKEPPVFFKNFTQ
jgi:hypothetical protein